MATFKDLINKLIDNTNAAVKTDAQTLTDTQKEQARSNIGAISNIDIPQKGVDYWTPADQESIVQDVIKALGTPVFGRVDEENSIILTGELSDGTYTLKYEDGLGGQVIIGVLEIGGVAYTNWIPISTDASGNIFNGVGYKENWRVSSGVDQAYDGVTTTGYIPVTERDVVYLKNVTMPKDGGNYTCRIALFDALGSTNQKNIQASNAADWVWDSSGNAIQFTVPIGWFADGVKAKYMRIGAAYIGPDSILTINEPIV